MPDLIIIIPILNEETILLRCYDSIRTQIKDCSILFIDDGSSDNSLGLIKNIVKTDKRVFFVSFSRNYGKEAAIFCGLEYAQNLKYKFTCIMDVDGQDPPEYLVNMYKKVTYEHFDAVACRRINRKGEGRIRSLFSSLFYKIINCLANVNIPEGARDYIMMNEQFRNALVSCKEKCRFFKGLYNSIGYRVNWIEYENFHIEDRKSRWSIMKLVAYALEGMISQSESLLSFSAIAGVIFFIISFIFLIFIFLRTIIFGDPVAGWTSLVCIILFMFGVQFIFVGIIGIYISKNYKELKNRPLYFEKEKNIM